MIAIFEGAGMKATKEPGVFLARFWRDEAPLETIDGLAGWAADKGFNAVPIPTRNKRDDVVKCGLDRQLNRIVIGVEDGL